MFVNVEIVDPRKNMCVIYLKDVDDSLKLTLKSKWQFVL